MGTDNNNILCGMGYRYVPVIYIFVFGRFAGATVLFGIEIVINIIDGIILERSLHMTRRATRPDV